MIKFFARQWTLSIHAILVPLSTVDYQYLIRTQSMKNLFTKIFIVASMVVSPIQSADTATSSQPASTSWLKIGAGSIAALLTLNKVRILLTERWAINQYDTLAAEGIKKKILDQNHRFYGNCDKTSKTTEERQWENNFRQAQRDHVQAYCAQKNRSLFMQHWYWLRLKTPLLEPRALTRRSLCSAYYSDSKTVWLPGLYVLLS